MGNQSVQSIQANRGTSSVAVRSDQSGLPIEQNDERARPLKQELELFANSPYPVSSPGQSPFIF